MATPFWHGRDELARIALRVPLARVRVSPARARLGIQVVEDRLHHSRVEQQPFDFLAVEAASFVGELAIDEELLAANRDFGAMRGRLGATWNRRNHRNEQYPEPKPHWILRYR